jgi:hypothetical protein
MLALALADSSDDPAYRGALLGARLFMTVTWVSRRILLQCCMLC